MKFKPTPIYSAASRQHQRCRQCVKCKQPKPVKGGTVVGPLKRFVCGDCK